VKKYRGTRNASSVESRLLYFCVCCGDKSILTLFATAPATWPYSSQMRRVLSLVGSLCRGSRFFRHRTIVAIAIGMAIIVVAADRV
jgi:hypothetical protein